VSLWRLATQPGMTEVNEKIDAAVVEWARRIPVGQIPSVLAFLSARLLAEGYAGRNGENNAASARDGEIPDGGRACQAPWRARIVD
jgi:hypothetical protein